MKNTAFVFLFAILTAQAAVANPGWVTDEADYTTVIDLFVSGLKEYGVTGVHIDPAGGYVEISEDREPFRKGMKFSLSNLYFKYQKTHDASGVREFVASVYNTLIQEKLIDAEMLDFSTAGKYLSVRIYAEEYAPLSHEHHYFRKEYKGTMTVVTVNTDFGIRPLTKGETEGWNMSEDRIFEYALGRTKKFFTKELEKVTISEDLTIYAMADYSNYFVNTMIYFPSFFEQFDGGSGVVIAMPSRHYFLILPVNPVDLDGSLFRFFNLVYGIFNGEEGATTLELIYHGKAGQIPITPLITNGSVYFIMPEELRKSVGAAGGN